MKKIVYLAMIFSITFCFIGGVNADYNEGNWATVNCGKTTSLDYETTSIELQNNAYSSYTFNSNTGYFTNSGTKYSELDTESQNSGVFYYANNNILKAYLIKVSENTFEEYGITNVGENDYCVITTTSLDNDISYNITSVGDMDHGIYVIKVNDSTSNTAKYGDTIEVDARADDHYEATIKVLNADTNQDVTNKVNFNTENQTFTMPAHNIKISIEFTKAKYTISKEVTNGSVTLPENATYGEIVEINPVADENYEISSDSIKILNSDDEDITSSVNYNDEDYTFEMPGEPVTVKVDFEKQNYNITKNDTENGSFTITVDEEEVTETKFDNIVKINPTANDYYEILPENIKILNSDDEDVTTEVNFNSEEMTFEMPKYDVKVDLLFTKINYVLDKAKSVEVMYGSISFPETATYGDEVTIDSTPNVGYALSQVFICDEDVICDEDTNINDEVNYDSSTNTFTMPGKALYITARFTTAGYNITKDVILGDISNPDLASFKVTLNGQTEESTEATYNSDMKIDSNITILDPVSYKCDNENGNCLAAIKIFNLENEDVTDEVGYNTSDGTFTMPNYDIKIKLYLVANRISINYQWSTGGELRNIQDKGSMGSTVALHIYPNSGYVLKSVNVTNVIDKPIAYDVNTNSFKIPGPENPSGTITVKVTFKKIPSTPTVTVQLYGYNDIKVTYKSTGAEGYKIYRNDAYIKAKTTTSASFINLTSGKKYWFTIKPYIKDIKGNMVYGTSKKSSYIYTLKRVSTPKVTKYSKSYVKVKWTNIYGESGYQISRSTKKTGTYIVKTVGSSYSSTLIKPVKNKKYYYKVRAYKTVNGKKIYGPWSYVKSYILR